MDIISLEPARYRETAQMLARAFYDDPMWSFIAPDAGQRARMTVWILEHWARVVAPLGASWVAVEDGAVTGAAWWFPPGEFEKVSQARMMQAGFGWMPLALGFRWARRSRRIFEEGVARQRSLMREPLWVLEELGVEPARQKTGVGRALLEIGLRKVDSDGAASLLVTHKKTNVAFYRRFGFEVIDEYQLSGGGPVAYSMRRPPS